MPIQMSVDLRMQALIEFKSLELLQFQKQFRKEILNTMKVLFSKSLVVYFIFLRERYISSNSSQSTSIQMSKTSLFS